MAGGVNLNARDKHGDTALMLASNNGSVEITEMLIKAEAKLDLQNIHGDTALMRASNNGHTEIAKMLIKAEAKLDLQNKDGATALMVASDNGHREIVELLIKAGADVSIKDQYGKTARDYAISEGHKDIAELLHSYEQKSAESQRKWWQSVAQDIVVALLAVGAVSGVAIGLDALCKSWQEKQARKRFTNAIDAQKSQLDAELSLIFSERGVITHNETVPLRASFTVTPERSRAMRDAISALWTEETITHIAAQISNEGHSAQLFLKTAGSLGRVYAQFQQDYIAPRIRTLWHESTEYKRLVEAKGYLAKTLTCSVEEDKKSLEDRLRKIAGELDTAQIHRAGLNACDNDKSDKRVETAIRENGVKKAVFEKDIIAGLTQKKDDFIAQLDAQEGYRNRCKKDSVILANAEDIIALKNQQSSGDITEALKNLGSVLENLRAMNKDLGEKVTTAQNHDTKNKQKHAAAKADMEKKLAPQREAEEQRIDEAMARMAELELAITRKMRENEQRWEKEALMPEEERKTPSPEPRAIVQRVAPEEVRNHERVRSADWRITPRIKTIFYSHSGKH
jgi:ankyrin repeat protein